MNFINLSPLAVIGGIVSLAALTFVLQWLRIRHRRQKVVTMMFWREAVEDTRVRTFWHRFRHLWPYLMVLAICSLLWIAFAEPETRQSADKDYTILILDGSAGMARDNQFELAVAELTSTAATLPRDRRQVLWAGGRTTTLLNPGEHELLLAKRLENLEPEMAPANVEEQLRLISQRFQEQDDVRVLVFGNAPVRQSVLDLIPDNIEVVRATELPARKPGNQGITSLGLAAAASGNWYTVDVFFQIEGDDNYVVGPEALKVELDGQPINRSAISPADNGQAGAYQIVDLPAKGGLLTLSLTKEDTLSVDNQAQVRLPSRNPIRVELSQSLAGDLGPLLSIDPAVEVVSESGDVVVRRASDPPAADGDMRPTLEFVSANDQPEAFLLGYPESFRGESVFVDAVESIGLNQIDAAELAQTAQRPIEVSAVSGDQWQFRVWQELLTAKYNFANSRAFPIFVSNSVRWLAGVQNWTPYAAAGEPLAQSSEHHRVALTTESGVPIDPLGGNLVPATAGELGRTADQSPLAVSLLDAPLTRDEQVSDLKSNGSVGGLGLPAQNSFLTWLLLPTLALVLVEWFLFQKGRMP